MSITETSWYWFHSWNHSWYCLAPWLAIFRWTRQRETEVPCRPTGGLCRSGLRHSGGQLEEAHADLWLNQALLSLGLWIWHFHSIRHQLWKVQQQLELIDWIIHWENVLQINPFFIGKWILIFAKGIYYLVNSFCANTFQPVFNLTISFLWCVSDHPSHVVDLLFHDWMTEIFLSRGTAWCVANNR